MNWLSSTTPRRVLMTADTIGGVWTYALELARALAPSHVQILLATMGRRLSRAQALEACALPNLEIFESAYKLEWMPSPWHDVAVAGDWLLELERTHSPDIVHLNNFVHGSLPWITPLLVAGHSCVLSWWQAVKHEPAPADWDEYRRRVAAGLHAADMVVAPTHEMLRALQRYYGPFPATRVIPNGRSGAWFKPDHKEPFVLTAGRLWDEAKNVGTLAKVAPKLPWPVCVAGSDVGPEGRRVQMPSVRFLGHLPTADLAGWLARAGIYALPARYEPFGLSILEAALSGCALVLGDVPSLRENWSEAAQFVSPNDLKALLATLKGLIDDASRRESAGERARAIALRFTPRLMATGYLAAYAELLERHAARTQSQLAVCAS